MNVGMRRVFNCSQEHATRTHEFSEMEDSKKKQQPYIINLSNDTPQPSFFLWIFTFHPLLTKFTYRTQVPRQSRFEGTLYTWRSFFFFPPLDSPHGCCDPLRGLIAATLIFCSISWSTGLFFRFVLSRARVHVVPSLETKTPPKIINANNILSLQFL